MYRLEGIRRIVYKPRGGATRYNHFASRGAENFTWKSHAVLEALQARPDIRPDVIVGHSGFGSTLFLPEFYNCPIVNYCEWFYRWDGSESDFRRNSQKVGNAIRLTNRCRDGALLADLDACTLGYSPTHWQRSRFPHEYQHKLETIFDGIDTTFWRPLKWHQLGRRRVAGHKLPRGCRVVTYISRGFESMRGFDVFMQIAHRICQRRRDVVFLCIGSDRVVYGGDLAEIPETSFREHVLKKGNFDLDRFIFTGPVSHAELRRALAWSDLHIYLTLPFILSWSMLDALACGCTVLASDTPPVREIIEHDRTGLMAPYYDVDAMVDLALQVLDDPAAYRRTLGRQGLELIHRHYDLEVVLPRMIELYHRAIQGEVPKPKDEDPRPIPEQSSIIAQHGGLDSLRKAYPWPKTENTSSSSPCESRDYAWLGTAEQTRIKQIIPSSSEVVLELGAWRGQTTCLLAQLCPQATIVAVDTWYGGKFTQPQHPDWKALIPWAWKSFVRRTSKIRHRVIPVRQRHQDAIRQIATAGIRPDVIFYDPEYNSRSVRETLYAILRFFPKVPLIGHDWHWKGMQRELGRAITGRGVQLLVQGNLWSLDSTREPIQSVAERPLCDGGADSASHATTSETTTTRTLTAPLRSIPLGTVLNNGHSNGQPVTTHRGAVPVSGVSRNGDPLRVLVTIPHYYSLQPQSIYGSGRDPRDRRIQIVRRCLESLHATIAGQNYTTHLVRPESQQANTTTRVRLQVVMCVSNDQHLVEELRLPPGTVEKHQVKGDPRFLGYGCQEVLRDRLGDFDFYVYLEDDLELSDPWIFAKLRWFAQWAGQECLLQPNRYELAEDGSFRKAYIDGELRPEATARYQNVLENPVLQSDFLGRRAIFRRPLNPHSGCFFLSADQMRVWVGRPYFLDRDTTFVGPLEGAATAGIMRTFRVYKPGPENANFLEVRHMGDTHLQVFAMRDRHIHMAEQAQVRDQHNLLAHDHGV
jgi:glycosyltransferase involved in cell wall biosynthesis